MQGFAIPSDYFTNLIQVESGGNPLAKSNSSSASGLFQFTKKTATSLGLNWGSGSGAFGGASNSTADQFNAANLFTQNNASALSGAGIPVSGNSLYASHFLGVGNAISVLGANDNTPLSSILPANVIQANSFLGNMSAGDFKTWVSNKGGGAFDPSNVFSNGQSTIQQWITGLNNDKNNSSGGGGGNEVNLAISAAGQATKFGVDLASGNLVGAGADAVSSILGAFGIGPNAPGKGGAASSSDPKAGIWSDLTSILDFLTNPVRIVYVIIGIILIGAAAIYFINSSKVLEPITTAIDKGTKAVGQVAATAMVAA